MKLIFSTMLICLTILGSSLLLTETKAQNVSQTCNSSGILLRADGTVVIDTWKDFSAMRNPTPPPPGMNVVTQFTGTDFPLAIMLGKSLHSNIKICIEDDNGSRCKPMDEYRKSK